MNETACANTSQLPDIIAGTLPEARELLEKIKDWPPREALIGVAWALHQAHINGRGEGFVEGYKYGVSCGIEVKSLGHLPARPVRPLDDD
jgi:hypothetical protein